MTSGSSTLTSNPSYGIDGSRKLAVEFDNWKWRKGSIFDADTRTELYRMESHMFSPQVVLYSVRDGAPSPESRGEASLHMMKSKINIRLHGQEIVLKPKPGFLKDGNTYVSPALKGATLTWQSKSKLNYLELLCLDENAMPVARVSLSNSFSLKKAGVIELASAVKSGPEMDEVVLTGLAMMQRRLMLFSSIGTAALAST